MSITLLTGSTGFIGSHVARQLIDAGQPVRLLVRDPTKLRDVGIDAKAPAVEVVRADLLECDSLAPTLDGVDRVFHIAGSISLARADRQLMIDINTTATRNLLDAAGRADVKRIVYLASIFALAGGDGPVADERSPWMLDDLDVPYVQAKRAAELDARQRAGRGMPIVFVYPCFCYGPGDVYESSSALLTGFLQGTVPAYVNGGHNAVDVRDVAASLIRAMDHGRPGERYIVGGENVTFEQLFGLLTYITGKPSPKVKLPAGLARMGGRLAERIMRHPPLTEQLALMTARQWYYDDAKARAEIGHASRPLEATMRDAVEWMEEHGRA